MALNPSIFNALLQPVRSVAEHRADYDAQDMARQKNALMQMQMAGQVEAMNRQKEMRGALQGVTDFGKAANVLMQYGDFEGAAGLGKLAQQQAEAQRKQAAEAQRQQALKSLLPTQAIDANRVSGVAGPRPEALGVVGQQRPFNPAQLLAAGISPKEVGDIQGLVDPRAEVKDYQQVRMPDGSVKVVGLTKDGKVIETGQSPFIKPEFQRMGSYVAAIDPVNLSSKNVGAINMSPGEAAQNARALQSLGLQRERLNFDKQRAASGPGGVGGVGGSPSAPGKPLTEAQAKASAFASQMEAAEREASAVNLDRSKISNQIDVAMAGSALNMLASSDAQRARQAQEQWAEAYLRFKTGAAATEGEVVRNIRTFFPQQGDGKDLIAQKERMRRQAVSDVKFTATGRQGETPPVVGAATGGAGGFSDADKEARYQAWKASQGAK